MDTSKFQTATAASVGDWGGQEALAAAQFNRIADAIARAEVAGFMVEEAKDFFDEGADADEGDALDILADQINEKCHYAWDRWGSDEALLNLTDKEIAEYVNT